MLLTGSSDILKKLQDDFAHLDVDQVLSAPEGWQPPQYETTLMHEFTVSGPATYCKGKTRTLHFVPSEDQSWRFKRCDLPEQLPIAVRVGNVFNSRRNIVLHSGLPENRVRMTEHIIAHRLGLGVDNVLVETNSEDPPLFDVGSMPIVEGILQAGVRALTDKPLKYWTVKEPVTIVSPAGDGFLEYLPAEKGCHTLTFDVAIDFPTAIGKQRIQFDLTPEIFAYGAQARTNCSAAQMRFVRYLGWMFEETRHFGYTDKNILVAGTHDYLNNPALIHHGKSLEACWHRACLDLIAALSLCPNGRLAGHIVSYKAGHTLDCRFMSLLECRGLLE